MSEQTQTDTQVSAAQSRKKRNIILGLVLALAALVMYGSIFLRLSAVPLQ